MMEGILKIVFWIALSATMAPVVYGALIVVLDLILNRGAPGGPRRDAFFGVGMRGTYLWIRAEPLPAIFVLIGLLVLILGASRMIVSKNFRDSFLPDQHIADEDREQ
ncbi:MAG: hypothetical protein Aurels2KO_30630 [Aureliella sp.]